MAQRKGILSVYRYEPVRSTSLENTLNASGCTPMSVQINLQSAGVTRCLTDFYVMLELQKNVFFTMKNKFTSQNIGASWHTQKTIILVVRTKFLATNSCKQNIYTSWADKSAAFLNAFRSASILRFVSFSLSNSLWNLRLIFQFSNKSLSSNTKNHWIQRHYNITNTNAKFWNHDWENLDNSLLVVRIAFCKWKEIIDREKAKVEATFESEFQSKISLGKKGHSARREKKLRHKG